MSDLSSNPYASLLDPSVGSIPVDPSLLPAAGGATTLPATQQQPLQPGVAESPYTFSSALAVQKVVLGQSFAQMLGLPASTGVSVAQVVSTFYNLSQAQQESVENILWQAGFYVDAQGDPLETQPHFGSADPSNVNALSNALLQASNANPTVTAGGQTLSSLTAALQASGAGAAERQLPPSPVMGGANTYQNVVTSPTDLYSQLYSTFESTLGRAPTQTELNNFINVFQGQQSGYQKAVNTQQETASMAKFKQQETARNTELAFERTPTVASPSGQGVPTGPFNTPAGWATAFLNYGGFPATASNIAFLLSVVSKLGGWANAQATHNPLGSALVSAAPGATTPITGPSPNAPQSYQTWAAGMQSTLAALQNFPNMVAVLKGANASNPPKALVSNLGKDLAKWSNGKLKVMPTPSPADLKAAHAAAAVAAKPIAPSGAVTSSPDYTGQMFGPPAAGFPGSAATAAGTPVPPPAPGAPGASAPVASPDETGKVMGPPAAGFPGSPGTPAPTPPGAPTPPVGQAAPPTQPAPATTPAADVVTGQDQYSAGDTYVGPSTLTGVAPPSSADDAAFQMATTGANAVPYMGNQYLNAFNVVANMIASGKVGAS